MIGQSPSPSKQLTEADLQFSQVFSSADAHVEEAPIKEQIDDFQKSYRYPAPQTSTLDTIIGNTFEFGPQDIPKYSPQIISNRLYNLPMLIPTDYNPYVQRYIDLYTQKRREQTSRMLGLSRVYFPIFEEYLDREGLPIELKYLPIVESALNPHARSRVGATGLWQFMLSTGRMYGLQVNSFIDERKDPYKSTIAACKYLKNAYKEFGDWLLAIASYNCGPGNVRKAIARSGGKRNFWEIRAYLPRETRGYVPAFIAVTYVFNYAGEHNLYPVFADFSYRGVDTLQLSRLDITLEEIAKMSRTDVNVLRYLNPELKLGRIPYSILPYTLRVPQYVSRYMVGNMGYIREKYGKKRHQSPKVAAAAYKSGSSTVTKPPAGTKLYYYKVQPGDVVGQIADRYGVRASQIAYWNNLRRYRIKVGQRLKIYTTPSKAARAGRTGSVSATAKSIPQPVTSGPGTYHTLRSGDTIWDIAKRYGVSVGQIQRLNPGLSPKNLKVGQRIRVK